MSIPYISSELVINLLIWTAAICGFLAILVFIGDKLLKRWLDKLSKIK